MEQKLIDAGRRMLDAGRCGIPKAHLGPSDQLKRSNDYDRQGRRGSLGPHGEMSLTFRSGRSFRTLLFLKQNRVHRICQLQLNESRFANSRLCSASEVLTEVKKKVRAKEIKDLSIAVEKYSANVLDINDDTPSLKKSEFPEKLDETNYPDDEAFQTKHSGAGARLELLENLANNKTLVSDHSSQQWDIERKRLLTRIENSAHGSRRRAVKPLNVDSFKKDQGQTSLSRLLAELESLDIANILSILCQRGKTQEAVDILFNYLYICNKLKNAQKPKQLYDVNLFNCIHRALAKQGEITWMDHVLALMTKQSVTPTLQTYAHFLECLGRSTHDQSNKIQQVIHQIEKQGLRVRDLYRDCCYISDEWTFVRKAVETVQDNFNPFPRPEQPPYNNPLLTHLDTPKAKRAKNFNPNKDIMSNKKLSQKIKGRLKLEKDEYAVLKPVVKIKQGGKRESSKEEIREIKKQWSHSLTRLYTQSFMAWNTQQTHKGYLEALTAKEFSDMVIEVVELMMRDSLQTLYWTKRKFAQTLGRRLMQKTQYFYMEKYGILDKVNVVYKEYAQQLLDNSHISGTHREIWEAICNRHMEGPTLGVPMTPWSYETQIWICTLSTKCYLLNKEPAFFDTMNRNILGKCLSCYMPHPRLLKLYKKGASFGFELSELPSTIPPVPWTSLYHGIHLIGNAELIRTPAAKDPERQKKLVYDKMSSSDILSIFDVLNYIGSCPWITNKEVLKIQLEVFRNNGSKEMNVPLPAPPVPLHLKKKFNRKEDKQMLIEKNAWTKKSFEMNSLWYSCLWMLTIAKEFSDKPFWLPLNLDYRGRVYCCSSILQYQSNDLTRSLFLFANGKPLGEKGLDWLKIHLINLTGLKKRFSNKDRLEYANQMMDKILDSADNPLKGEQWWLQSDEPWQTLACCMEIAKAIRSDDPTKFISHFPVHQDGSCNGLQHYAALGRDKSGAKSINLDSSEAPEDVYSDIMEMVELQRQEDEKNGKEIAKMVAPYITRKVVKRPVMTSVYGVTHFGARLQVQQVLKEIPGFPEEHLKEISAYIVDTIMSNLKKKFQTAGIIQEWFNEVAKATSAGLKKHVEWKTPLGLLVVQMADKSFLQKNPITKETRRVIYPDTIKQRQSFPPNFIHSLDSVHMMLTALHCMKKGLTFSSVHDCFWTHACDIDTMNKICREQFVVLHSQPLLQQLSDYMLEAHKEELKLRKGMKPDERERLKGYAKVLKCDKIKLGDFDLNNVLDSEYFFS
ncbi:DNA-directed RNA polymerase, mitochondrial-like [Argopecten irradians]|uniref:DNA-directed RNA polymerase, mitochondrial-like n=1 Tax=Argopecten irradians TaxID=31199 RepID=UPI00371F7223